MFDRWFSSKIRVELFEQGKDKPFSYTLSPLEDLPDSFELNTTLNLADGDWAVKEAIPLLKSEFSKTKKLKLVLNKIIRVDPSKLLFSIPTISDGLAVASPSEGWRDALEVHEDDWRQIEFVEDGFEPEVRREFQAILKVLEGRTPIGAFKELHVRKDIPTALSPGTLSLRSLKELCDSPREWSGVTYSGSGMVIERSFAFDLGDGGKLWGQGDEAGNVLFLNLMPEPDRKVGPNAARVMAGLFGRGLMLVDWSRAAMQRGSELS